MTYCNFNFKLKGGNKNHVLKAVTCETPKLVYRVGPERAPKSLFGP